MEINTTYTLNYLNTFQHTSRLEKLYTKEDLLKTIYDYRNADIDRKPFLEKEIREKCNYLGIDFVPLMKDESLLDDAKFPCLKDIKLQTIMVYEELFNNIAGPEDYMSRLVKRLSKDYSGNSISVEILRQFILGEIEKSSKLGIGSIEEAVHKRVTAEEWSHYKSLQYPQKQQFLAAKIDDALFSELISNINKKREEHRDLRKKDTRKDKRKLKFSPSESLINLCDDLANGRIRKNTRYNLYCFAIMFGMTVSLKGETTLHQESDIEKNLFADYLNDNYIRFIDHRNEIESSAELKELGGGGINYKNYVETIFVYCIIKDDSSIHEIINNDPDLKETFGDVVTISPGIRLRLAEELRSRVEAALSNAYKNKALNNSEIMHTEYYQGLFLEEMLGTNNAQKLVECILNHYPVGDYKPGKVSITIAESRQTAKKVYDHIINDIDIQIEDQKKDTADHIAHIDYGLKKRQKDSDSEVGVDYRFFEPFTDAICQKHIDPNSTIRKVTEKIQARCNELKIAQNEPAERVTRTQFVIVCTLEYLFDNIMYRYAYDESQNPLGNATYRKTISFPDVYRSFKTYINARLEEARFPLFCEHSILDLFMLFSVYYYMVDEFE